MRDQKNSDSLFFLILNANKRSLTLNLKTDEGKELFRKVIAQSDVLVENFGPGALDLTGGYSYNWSHAEYPWFLANGLSTDLLAGNGVTSARTVAECGSLSIRLPLKCQV